MLHAISPGILVVLAIHSDPPDPPASPVGKEGTIACAWWNGRG